MVMTLPGAYNTYVKDHESSGKMVVDFSRNIKDFAVNSYCQIQPVEKMTGLYLYMNVEEAGRIVNSDGSNFVWADGAEAPLGAEGTEYHEYRDYRGERYLFGVPLGDLTVDQSSWDIVQQYLAMKAQQAMTLRTQKVITALTTTGNYDASHYSAVASISGNTGNWAASTSARQDIKRSLNTAALVILKDTLGAVKLNELCLVINPTLASSMAISQEIVDHIKGSPDALAQIRGELPGRNAVFGLPDKLYGFPVIVEQTVKVTNRKGGTKTPAFVLGDSTAVMCARPGGLVGVANAPTFSTVVLFMKEEMTSETKRDDDNRRTKARIVENYAVELVAPVSGYVFTSAA